MQVMRIQESARRHEARCLNAWTCRKIACVPTSHGVQAPLPQAHHCGAPGAESFTVGMQWSQGAVL